MPFSFFSNILSKLVPSKKPQPEAPKPVPAHTDEQTASEVLHRLSYDVSNFSLAFRKFQSDQGLQSDGKLGPNSMARVRKYEEKLKLAPLGMKQMRRFRATHYYIAEERDYSGPTVPVYNLAGKVICNVAASFFCNTSLEGTGKLRDGRLINVGGRQYVKVNPDIYAPAAEVYKKHIAYMKSKGRDPRPSRYFGIDYKDGIVTAAQPFNFVEKLGKGFGIGKKGIPHETNRTVATDQGLYGTSEPRFKGKGGLWEAGVKGWVIDAAGEGDHDGWVQAADVGGGIFGAHFDFFVGTKEHVHDLPVRSNAVTYVWFEGIEDKIPASYEYGLYDK